MGMLLVGCTQYLTLVRARGGQQPLIVHARYDIRKLAVPILLLHLWIKGLEAGRQYDRPNLYFCRLLGLFQIYCLVLAHPLANTTFVLFEVKTTFIDICNKGNRLSKIYMYGFIQRYILIILIRVLDGAIFYTGSTTSTFMLENIPWLLGQAYSKVSRLTFYTVDFSIGEDLYVGMPADLDQLGRQYSHGAVIGGKGLVQLRHMAANARGLFNQVNLKTGRGKIKRGLNAADSSTDNHYVAYIVLFKALAELPEFLFQK
jgi:hypothetical protein